MPAGSQPTASSFLSLVAPHLHLRWRAQVSVRDRRRWTDPLAQCRRTDVLGGRPVGALHVGDRPRGTRRARSRRAEPAGRRDLRVRPHILTESGEERRVEIGSSRSARGIARSACSGRKPQLGPRPPAALRRAADDAPAESRASRRGESRADRALLRRAARRCGTVRHILRRLGTSSRLEAVAVARREKGPLRPRPLLHGVELGGRSSIPRLSCRTTLSEIAAVKR